MLAYLDTNIWIYAYEDDPVFGSPARRLFQDLRSGKHRLASSLFVLGELLVLPTRKQNAFALASYRRLFASPELVLLPYNAAATQAYAELRAFQRLQPLDALHLATAAAAHVDLFITHDAKLLPRSVPGIGTIADTTFALP
jgi:predicted nucleic acid-binding protein